jgi:hypothetical protein
VSCYLSANHLRRDATLSFTGATSEIPFDLALLRVLIMQDDATPYPIEDWARWAPSIRTEYPTSRWKQYESAEQAGWSLPALADAQRFSEEVGSAR